MHVVGERESGKKVGKVIISSWEPEVGYCGVGYFQRGSIRSSLDKRRKDPGDKGGLEENRGICF